MLSYISLIEPCSLQNAIVLFVDHMLLVDTRLKKTKFPFLKRPFIREYLNSTMFCDHFLFKLSLRSSGALQAFLTNPTDPQLISLIYRFSVVANVLSGWIILTRITNSYPNGYVKKCLAETAS